MSLPELTQPEKAELDAMVREAVDSHIMSEAQAEHRKDIAANAKEKFGIKPADFNKLVNERHKEKSTSAVHQHEEIQNYDEELRLATRNQRK